MENMLLHGDNLQILEQLIEDNLNGCVDLVYIDPPFATNQKFTVSNDRSATISRERDGVVAYSDNFTLEEFINYLKPRMKLIHQLLSNKGSFYFHIDYKIGHYVKVMLDEIFGIENFKADISRIKCNPKNFKRKNYGNVKDMVLFYTKTKSHIWNDVGISETDCAIRKRFTKKDGNGKLYTTVPLHAPGETVNGDSGGEFMGVLPPKGRHWRYAPKVLEKLYNEGMIETSKNGNMRLKRYADTNLDKKTQDVWEFKDPQNPSYPTEKNQSMLDYIVLNSSNPGSTVLDCFCGSGTTLASAYKYGRNYIGIDQSSEAIKATKKKLASVDEGLL